MARVVDNFISIEDIKIIKDYFKDRPFENVGYHPDYPDKLQWANSHIPSWIWEEILNPLIEAEFGNFKVSPGTGKFQRCHVPFGMHIDSKARISKLDNVPESVGYGVLIPLDEAPEFCTIFWKEYFDTDNDKVNSFMSFGSLPDNEVRNSHLGDKYDLDFCWEDPRRKIFNHYEFDCAFPWKLGSMATFPRNQLHAATDFTKKFPYKDAITIFCE